MKQLFFIALLATFSLNAQSIVKSSIDSGGGSVSAGNIQMLYTIGEVFVQERSAGNIQLSEGFINPISMSISVNPRVFLEGPYTAAETAGLMNDNLRANDQLPTTSPYIDALTCDISVFNITGDDAIVDWVYVELRDAADRSVVLETKSALLQRDGDVVSIDGSSPVSLTTANGSYYLLIGHRNHLSILSATPILFSSNTVVDLSSDPIDIYGSTNAVTAMNNGVEAMIGGDVNNDGIILNDDLAETRTNLSLQAYISNDIDMDGFVLNQDISLIIRPNLSKAIQY